MLTGRVLRGLQARNDVRDAEVMYGEKMTEIVAHDNRESSQMSMWSAAAHDRDLAGLTESRVDVIQITQRILERPVAQFALQLATSDPER